jgi:hypothetical protein
MNVVVSLQEGSLCVLMIQLLYDIRYLSHVVLTRIIVLSNAHVSKLSMFAVPILAPACFGHLNTLPESCLTHMFLELNESSLYALDDFLAI